MGKVRLLDKHTAELIAAGEVVERPASVIKELVENSIDAGAKAITVEIKSGGVLYMRVSDDGGGISHEDVPTAFLRHATSKIVTGEDLNSIATLGFRGEALASVASVSKVELITRTKEQEVGTHYVIEGGEELVYDECGCAVGTTIIVRDIFYNTPARMKFLKKDVQEGNAVASCIDRLALSHPEISFRMVREGKQTLMTPGDGRLISAVFAVFGKEFASGLTPVEYAYNNVKVSGYITVPTVSRPNSAMQVFFINGRYCRSKTMQAALEQGYKGAMMVGRHPACVLDVQIDCAAVDVNVHPAKLEVRFTNERQIFDGVYYAVTGALSRCDARREIKLNPTTPAPPAMAVEPKPIPVQAEIKQLEKPAERVHTVSAPKAEVILRNSDIIIDSCGVQTDKIPDAALSVKDEGVYAYGSPSLSHIPLAQKSQPKQDAPVITDDPYAPSVIKRSFHSQQGFNINISAEETLLPEKQESFISAKEPAETRADASEPQAAFSASELQETHTAVQTEPSPKQPELPPYRIIGEVFATYIMIESGSELILIDKHAAHERLIYERLIASETDAQAQLLLEPISVTLDKMQYDQLLQNADMMLKAGFEIEDFGPGTVLVRTAPSALADGDVADAVLEIAGNFGIKKNALLTERMEHMYHTIACRSAIKANDRSLEPELAALVMQLYKNPDVKYCPHGRPIYTVLKKKELEKSFGRIQ